MFCEYSHNSNEGLLGQSESKYTPLQLDTTNYMLIYVLTLIKKFKIKSRQFKLFIVLKAFLSKY